MRKFKAVIISDIHYGRDIDGKLGAQAGTLMQKFARFVKKEKPDLVIDLGDRISCASHKQDVKHLKSLSRYFNKLSAPRVHILGNHDTVFMDASENAQILGSITNSYSFDINGIHIVAWNPPFHIDKREIRLPPEDLAWLEKDLANTDKPVMILSHVPLDYNGQTDQDRTNPSGQWFYKRFADNENIRDVLERSGKNFLNLAGDHHRNYMSEINDIYYITMHSLTQKQTGGPHPVGAFAVLEINDDKIRIDVKGREPQIYHLESAILKQHKTPQNGAEKTQEPQTSKPAKPAPGLDPQP